MVAVTEGCESLFGEAGHEGRGERGEGRERRFSRGTEVREERGGAREERGDEG